MKTATMAILVVVLAGCSAGGGPYTYDNARGDLELAYAGLRYLHADGTIKDEHWPIVESAYVEAIRLIDDAEAKGDVDVRSIARSASKILLEAKIAATQRANA